MKIAYISTYTPRECGIATFNKNLMQAIGVNFKKDNLAETGFVIALNDSEDLQQYDYPEEVKFVIRQNYPEDYLKAINYINTSPVDVCVLEHEFGIFGGDSGNYILPLINGLNKPVITVLHTVLREPSFMQKAIIQEIANQSANVVVMSRCAVDFLVKIYNIPAAKIKLIEHGVPDLEAPVENPVKKIAAFRDKRVLLTFGLLSRNKGLETVIQALPAIIAEYPDVMYVILGNTHPGVLKNLGEEYREFLKLLAIQLKVENHLTFINHFVSEEELIYYLTAATIYVTPYLNEAQITSGTLSYAVGAGAAIVSTPYWHACELLENNRGRLFNFKDARGLSIIVKELLENDTERNQLKNNAYQYGLNLRWPKIGAEYIILFQDAIDNKHNFEEQKLHQLVDPEIMPMFSLAHVKRLTDDTGIVQHAKFGIPNLKEGYCLDDNSRALIMALMAYGQNKSQEALNLLPVYLSYIHYMQLNNGNFRNFLSFNRSYLDEVGSEDSFGRTVWALGYMVSNAPNTSYQEFAEELFFRSVPHFQNLKHLRGVLNTIIGIAYFLQVHTADERMLTQLNELTEIVVAAYREHKRDDWHWFEEKLTYDNAIFPLALFHSCGITGNKMVKQIALESLDFLNELTLKNGYLSPVGNNGWHQKDNEMPVFDQQAIETMGMVLMYIQAYHVDHQPESIRKMFLCYLWFLGENTLRVPLYDHETKGCCDGLGAAGVNRNQGAESTLAYLIAHLSVLNAFELEYQYNLLGEPLISGNANMSISA
jgi:glycosyltransferase involved in cell wall biosynthesis